MPSGWGPSGDRSDSSTPHRTHRRFLWRRSTRCCSAMALARSRASLSTPSVMTASVTHCTGAGGAVSREFERLPIRREGRPRPPGRGNVQHVHPMTARRSTALPILLLLLGACSGSAPDSAASPAAKGESRASALASTGDLRGSIRILTSRAAENLEVSQGHRPGSQVVRIREGFSEVVLAKTNADGTVSTRCVDSPEGADAFLNDPSPSGRIRAAQ
jgi:hypothetical protein